MVYLVVQQRIPAATGWSSLHQVLCCLDIFVMPTQRQMHVNNEHYVYEAYKDSAFSSICGSTVSMSSTSGTRWLAKPNILPAIFSISNPLYWTPVWAVRRAEEQTIH